MAYVAPTPVSDGNALSAANLNALSDAVEYLYGVSSAPQVAMNRIYETSGGTHYLAFQYMHAYMHIEYQFSGLTSGGDLKVYVYDDAAGWQLMLQDGSPSNTVNTIVWQATKKGGFNVGTDTYDQVGDYTAGTNDKTLTVGNLYELRVEIDYGTGTSSISIPYIINADATSL